RDGGTVGEGDGFREGIGAQAQRLHRGGPPDAKPIGGRGDAGQSRPARVRRYRAGGAEGRRHVGPPARPPVWQRGAGRAGDAAGAGSGRRLACLRGFAMSRALPRAPGWGRGAGAVWPPREDFHGLIGRGNLIPVSREILADLETPVSAFLKVHRGPYGFLLESVQGGERWGRFSFLGTEPAQILRVRRREVELETPGNGVERWTTTDPLGELKRLLGAFHA